MIKKEYRDIVKATIAGGEITKKYFGKALKIEGKSMPSDFRTKADLGAEKAILKILEKKFPAYNINSEEIGSIDKNSEYTFVVDPLDGTNNFVLGIPQFSISIGLMKGEETIFGVVYNPILDNIYFAEKGGGAFLNNKKIRVNRESDIEKSSVSLIVSYAFSRDDHNDIVNRLNNKKVKRILTNWSALLDFGLLASGKIEAIMLYELPLHDFVAGKLIAKEAGALVTDFKGVEENNDKNNRFLITNGTKIHQEMLKILP